MAEIEDFLVLMFGLAKRLKLDLFGGFFSSRSSELSLGGYLRSMNANCFHTRLLVIFFLGALCFLLHLGESLA